MKLSEYMEEEKITISVLAKRSGLPYNTVKNTVEGGNVTLKNAYKLKLATRGKCKLEDMLPEASIKEGNPLKNPAHPAVAET